MGRFSEGRMVMREALAGRAGWGEGCLVVLSLLAAMGFALGSGGLCSWQ